jgi:peptide/nickel transport system substrate-binding protein
MNNLQYSILGPLQVHAGGSTVSLGGTKQRTLLAVLLLHANEALSKDRLAEELWGGAPPSSAGHSLEVYVSQLRKVLGATSAQPLVTRPPGYELRVEPGELDLHRFEELTAEGRSALREADAASASRLLREALAIWRGAALGDIVFEGPAAHEAEGLNELRVAAEEDRIEADLLLGRHHELVGDLEKLVRRNPLRERLRRQLMLALYRSGRQSEALDVYRDARKAFVSELGIEPGVELQRLEQAILAQDPSLEPTATPRASVLPPASSKLVPAVGVAALAIAALALGLYLTVGHGQHTLAAIDANALGLVDPRSGEITSEVRIGSRPTKAAIGFGSLWITHFNDNRVTRVDLDTRSLSHTIVVGSGPSGVAVGGGAVWVVNNLDGTVSRIEPRTNTVVQKIEVGNAPGGVAFGDGAVWVANAGDFTVSRIDPVRGRVTKTLRAGGDATGVAVTRHAVWVTNAFDGTVTRIDPTANAVVQTIHVGNGPGAVAAGAEGVWVANSRDGTVSHIDPQTNSVVSTTQVGNGPSDITVTGDAVWVTNAFDGTVSTLDGNTGVVERTRRVGNLPETIAEGAGAVWIGVAGAGGAHRGGTLAISLPVLDYDPGNAYDIFSWEIFLNTNDGLTGFKRVGGSDGTQVVPDLASALPTPTENGTRYTFRLRSGIRYSIGTLVRASDFRRGLERVFKIHSPGAGFFTGILGGDACAAHPAACDLDRGIVTDDESGTIVFRLSAPDTEFLYKLALPFAYPAPPGTPDTHNRTRPIPGTGPYAISFVGKHELRLVRNRYFHEWSKEVQPAGYPDAIVARVTDHTSAGIRDVMRGKLDWVGMGTSAPVRLPELRVRYASQLHINPFSATSFMVMNTRLPPFNDPRVRRALNYAVDRSVWVKIAGGTQAAQTTCQILPPSLPGYRPYCPFRAPDLEKARQLIAASGTKGMKVVVFTMSGYFEPLGQYFVSLLRSLGYRASLTHRPLDEYFQAISNSRHGVQIAFDNWIADYPAASNFFNALLSCRAYRPGTDSNTNRAQFCDRRIDAHIRRALAVQASDPEAANVLWARLDREIVNLAPWVPMTNPKMIDFVSKRVGNFQYNLQWGILLDQLWVR